MRMSEARVRAILVLISSPTDANAVALITTRDGQIVDDDGRLSVSHGVERYNIRQILQELAFRKSCVALCRLLRTDEC